MVKFISILPITLYILHIYVKYGVQKSFSDSYYIKEITKWERRLFIASLVATSLLFIVGRAIDVVDYKTIILFFAGLGICYTASAAAFKENKIIETWHMAGAFGGYVLGYAYIVALWGWESLFFIVPSFIAMGGAWLIETRKEFNYITYVPDENRFYRVEKYVKKTTWWFEAIGLITIYIASIWL